LDFTHTAFNSAALGGMEAFAFLTNSNKEMLMLLAQEPYFEKY
jgi:hypothetical protein